MRRVSSQFSFDPAKVDNASDQGIEGAMVGVAFGDKEPAVGQIAEAWHKPEPQQMAEPEHVLGRAAGIGIVLPDDERAFMVEEAIQNVGRLASVSRNDLGVERRKPVRNVGIELYAWFRPVVGVVIGASLAVAASPEELPIGRGSIALTPEGGKRLSVDRIDQAGQSGLVGLIAEVPFSSPEEPSMAEHSGTPRHAREPEVGGVGQHCRHQCERIFWYRAGAQVDEALGKTGPGVDLGEQFGNPDARQHAVEAPGYIVDIRVTLPDRADRQARLGDQGLGKFTRGGECGNFLEPPLQGLETLVAPSVKAVGDGELQLTSLSLSRERGGRQQEVIEGPEGPAALDPDISGAKSIPKRHDHGNLPGATVNSRPYPDQLAPRRRQKRGRHPSRELPLFGCIELVQQVERGEQGIGRLP